MSHKATTWLASLEARDIGNAEFRVLFHLCDCHNPSLGCFPTQAYLLDVCGVSNGTLNNALKRLEEKGVIRRVRQRDSRSRKQKPTHYILGFEMEVSQEPSPKTGDGKRAKPTPISGDGADSNFRREPTPISGGSRLQPAGEVTCKEPVNNHEAARARRFFTADERFEAGEIADCVAKGQEVDFSKVSPRVLECYEALFSDAGQAEKGDQR